MPAPRNLIVCFLLALTVFSGSASAQNSLDVRFRFYPSFVVGERAFLPGTFNNWGLPYLSGTNCILEGNASQMTFNQQDRYLWYEIPLQIGSTVEYKIQVHLNVAGTNCEWQSDPLNQNTVPPDGNSQLQITDPLLFQLAEEKSISGEVIAYSAGLFSTQSITGVTFWINDVLQTDGMPFFDATTGIFRYEIPVSVRPGSQFAIEMTDAGGRIRNAKIGEIKAPIDWLVPPFTTVLNTYDLKASLTRGDGTIDPALTQATLVRNGTDLFVVSVNLGVMEATAGLIPGDNEFRLRATIGGQEFLSDPLVVEKRIHPSEREFITAFVTGGGFNVSVILSTTDQAPSGVTTQWSFDERASTVAVSDLLLTQTIASATATGPGELYFNVTATRGDGETDFMRIAVIVDANGNAQQMSYAQNAAWIKNAVVYEIFPLTFGPLPTGSVSSPSNRLREITTELDYIAQMGFNTIWFMPIMFNQSMTPISGGYNIIDFMTVDPRLGTNDDFKLLVERAHELGIHIVLDLTPNHTSPAHPWVSSLAADGPFGDFMQTTPNSHTSGLDGRGANLSEIWQTRNGENFYRKYDGFGDLANVDWANDDLQASMLDIISFWVEEFGIDGWRFDVYWGPWRKWGPDRFGRPVRNLMKRIRPDAWLLGEIAGTGSNTEVYYADNNNGNRVIGGLDAAYDWNFYWDGIRGGYSATNFHNKAFNGGFWPGPNARYFRFLENHDEVRIAKLSGANPDRIKVMTGFLMTSTGIPMVYQGQEVNYGNFSGDTRRTPVNWNTERNGEFARLHQRLAQARAQFPAFGTQTMNRLETGSSSVYGVVRPWQDQNAVVVINFAAVSQSVTIDPSPFVDMSIDAGPIPYYDINADTSASYLGAFEITIGPFETVTFITSADPGFQLPGLPALPFGAVYTGSEELAELPDRIELDQNYPNPFHLTTSLVYRLRKAGPVRLSVFDILGREIARPVDEYQLPGRYTAEFHAGHLSSGVYLYRLEADGESVSRMMTLLR